VVDDSVGLRQYKRLEHGGLAIYVHPDCPDWFVPSSRADRLLKSVLERGSLRAALSRADRDDRRLAEQFLTRLDRGGLKTYTGRAHHLALKQLKECWFHITNRCNLS